MLEGVSPIYGLLFVVEVVAVLIGVCFVEVRDIEKDDDKDQAEFIRKWEEEHERQNRDD